MLFLTIIYAIGIPFVIGCGVHLFYFAKVNHVEDTRKKDAIKRLTIHT